MRQINPIRQGMHAEAATPSPAPQARPAAAAATPGQIVVDVFDRVARTAAASGIVTGSTAAGGAVGMQAGARVALGVLASPLGAGWRAAAVQHHFPAGFVAANLGAEFGLIAGAITGAVFGAKVAHDKLFSRPTEPGQPAPQAT